MEDYALLRKIGLTEGEAKVYLSLIELGTTTVGPIIDKAEISSSKVYIILEKLVQKGLVSYITKNKTKHYQAANPTKLVDFVERKEKEILQTKKETIGLANELKNKTFSKQKESASIYRGYEGLKTAWGDAIEAMPTGGTYYFFSFGYGGDISLQSFFRNMASALKNKRVKIKGLANKREKALYKKFYSKIGYDMRYTDFELPADTTIAGENILILSWDKKEPIVYNIKSATLSRTYQHFLDQLWEAAEK